MEVQMHSYSKLWALLEDVADPEIPVLSVVDLGVVRDIKKVEGDGYEVTITPTYSGCPAMKMIESGIKGQLETNGYAPVRVKTVLSPAWTTDWLTEKGRKNLKEYGIAPPQKGTVDKSALFSETRSVECPQCGSHNTKMLSQFGSTACKALHQCLDCKEPFDYFKCH